jgi:hypothetical protein
MSKRDQISSENLETIQKLFGHIKVNLPDKVGSTNGEGIWAVPCTEQDAKLARDDASKGNMISVWAANGSYYYPDITVGSKVQCLTNGSDRPYALWDGLQDTKKAPARREATLKTVAGQGQ